MIRTITCCLILVAVASSIRAADGPQVEFKMQEIERDLGIGYAVVLADVNDDKKLDIVVVDTTRVLWYENPTWKRHILIEGKTAPDNVCIAAHDIDGDGKIDFALGAGWKPFDTKKDAPLYWLRRGKNVEEPWEVIPIGGAPAVHRIRFADIDGSGKKALVSAPLMGRNATKEKNWMDGQPVQVTAYRIPKDPIKDRWTPEMLDESLHVVHNFAAIRSPGGVESEILTASYEGVNLLTGNGGKWRRTHIGDGNQDTPNGNRGSSEIKHGLLKGSRPYIATVEPWHGHQIVVYTPSGKEGASAWSRAVIDENLKWGHAVSCADLDGDGSEELIIGVRDNKSGKAGEKSGVRIYKAADESGKKWQRQLVDEGGVAIEDLTVGDLDGDGKPDIVAVGRATKNVRIYWNMGKK